MRYVANIGWFILTMSIGFAQDSASELQQQRALAVIQETPLEELIFATDPQLKLVNPSVLSVQPSESLEKKFATIKILLKISEGDAAAASQSAREAVSLFPDEPYFKWMLARCHIFLGDKQRALEICKQIKDRCPAASVTEAQLMMDAGRFDAALVAIEPAIDPPSCDVSYIYALIQFQLGNIAEAKQIALNAAKLQPRFLPAQDLGNWKLATVCAFAQGQLAEAEQYISNALTPKAPVDILLLGCQIKTANGKFTEAVELSHRIHQYDPEQPTGYICLARAAMSAGEQRLANVAIRELMNSHPSNKEVIELSTASAGFDQDSVSDLEYEMSMAVIEKNPLEKLCFLSSSLLTVIDQLVARDLQSDLLQKKRTVIRILKEMKTGSKATAVKVAVGAVETYPDEPYFKWLLAKLYFVTGQQQQGLSLCRSIRTQCPVACLTEARFLIERQQLKAALTALEPVLSTSGRDVSYTHGLIHYGLGNFSEAKKIALTGAKLQTYFSPTSVSMNWELAAACAYAQKQFTEAERYIKLVLNHNARDDVLMLAWRIKNANHKFSESVRLARLMQERHPEKPDGYLWLGQTAMSAGQKTLAKVVIRELFMQFPGHKQVLAISKQINTSK